jgi:hypothetical protein
MEPHPVGGQLRRPDPFALVLLLLAVGFVRVATDFRSFRNFGSPGFTVVTEIGSPHCTCPLSR